jgi:lipopolysaccharide/colanic/teichoic acid biosynthesis glycosyltransferase
MSLVGPRPDSAEFLDTLPASLRSGLASIRPGITSVATLKFRNEEELLSRVPENELASFYINTQLPAKVRLDLEYASHASLFTDLKLLLKTVLTILR